MTTNIISLLTDKLGDVFINNTANTVNEQPSNIKKAISAIIPSFLVSLLGRKQTLGGDSFRDLFNISNRVHTDHNAHINEYNILKNAVWGSDNTALYREIENYADVSSTSAKHIVDAATPHLVNGLSAHKPANVGIIDWIIEQKDHILAAIPSNFNLTNALGIGSLMSLFSGHQKAPEVKHTAQHINHQHHQPVEEPKKSGNNGLIWLLLVALVALLLWWLLGKGCNNDDQVVTRTDTTTNVVRTTETTTTTTTSKIDPDGNYIYDVGENTVINLADGTTLTVGKNSTEYKLYDFLMNGTIDQNDKTKNWIPFDRVYFKLGNAELTDKSRAQVDNIAKILKNFPNAALKLGGYTDNTGDAAINKKLSTERAQIVAKLFGDLGVAKQIEEAVGYGPEHPIATNDTDEGRAQNRRVDLKVSKK